MTCRPSRWCTTTCLLVFTCCHLERCRWRPRWRAQPADAVAAEHKPEVAQGAWLGQRGHDDEAPHPGPQEDRGGPHPVPGAGRPRAPRSVGRGGGDRLPRVQRGLQRDLRRRSPARRPGRTGHRPRAVAGGADAGRGEPPRPARAHAAPARLVGPPGSTKTASLVLLAEQDRSRWDQGAIREGVELVGDALRRTPDRPDRYVVQAAIAACHGLAPRPEDTDWDAIVSWFDVLLTVDDSPVVHLNRAAVAEPRRPGGRASSWSGRHRRAPRVSPAGARGPGELLVRGSDRPDEAQAADRDGHRPRHHLGPGLARLARRVRRSVTTRR